MELKQKIYCSLDIETSGFDPKANEILEVGFVLFEVRGDGFEILEEWTQVFKPTKPVTPQILGLTGISQAELDNAPSFDEHQKFLQEKLGSVVIVGHNVIFDIKFLEAFGIKFSGEVIDTLELVQFLLPTHHSYNLENLMHVFKIEHKDAHRALADSKAALKLIENLIKIFHSFSVELQEKIFDLINKFDFPWENILRVKAQELRLKDLENRDKKAVDFNQSVDFDFASNKIFNFPLNINYINQASVVLRKQEAKALLVVPKPQQVLELYRIGAVDAVVFSSENLFDKKAFAIFLKKKDKTAEELKFILKILVWRETNWQTETILDLNLSFFGGQFRSFITGGKIKEDTKAGLIVCDHATFLEISNLNLFSERKILICGLNEFETSITKDLGSKISWGYVSYLLKGFYNVELNTGPEKFKEIVIQALADTDLFFGLINALLQTDPPSFQYYKINSETIYQESYLKIKGAAVNYQEKMLKHNLVLESETISNFVSDLKNFFETEENRIKWIELSENRCGLLSMPIKIDDLVQGIIKPFERLSFADDLTVDTLVNFFISRLGIGSFKVENLIPISVEEKKNKKPEQPDLFSSLKKVLNLKKKIINYHCIDRAYSSEEILKLISKDKSLPGVILFGNVTAVREFYDQYYLHLKQRVSLLAQANSGGSNKIFRNFSINQNGLLLATDKFILRHIISNSPVEQVLNLSVKTLVICKLPFEQFTHPYQEAISQSSTNSFMDYALPKALFNFHSIIKFFSSPILEDIYIIDIKLNKEYATVFKEYYKSIPGAEIV